MRRDRFKLTQKVIPLPYDDLYIFLAGGGVLLLIGTFIGCFASKKKK